MKNRFLLLLAGFITLAFVGCGPNVAVSGKVTFEDGTPLKIGTVVFENEKLSARGTLNANGEYQLGTTKATNGLPPGDYQVFIVGAVEEIIEETKSDEYAGNAASSNQIVRETKPLIDNKYKFPEKSGLTCSVRGKTTFDFVVEPAQ